MHRRLPPKWHIFYNHTSSSHLLLLHPSLYFPLPLRLHILTTPLITAKVFAIAAKIILDYHGVGTVLLDAFPLSVYSLSLEPSLPKESPTYLSVAASVFASSLFWLVLFCTCEVDFPFAAVGARDIFHRGSLWPRGKSMVGFLGGFEVGVCGWGLWLMVLRVLIWGLVEKKRCFYIGLLGDSLCMLGLSITAWRLMMDTVVRENEGVVCCCGYG